MSSETTNQPTRMPWLHRHEQFLWASSLTIMLLFIAGYAIVQQRRAGRLIEIDHAAPLPYEFVVDLNTANWAELTVLPGISETYARRIVEYREAHGPFASVDELTNVPGIGPKKLSQLKRHLTVQPVQQPSHAT